MCTADLLKIHRLSEALFGAPTSFVSEWGEERRRQPQRLFKKNLKNVVIDVKTFANIKKMYYLCTALHLVRALHIESVFAVLQENVEVFKN